MKNKFTCLVALVILIVFASSCGTTTYRAKKYKTNKFIGYKAHWYKWHAHHNRPRPHYGGGYW